MSTAIAMLPRATITPSQYTILPSRRVNVNSGDKAHARPVHVQRRRERGAVDAVSQGVLRESSLILRVQGVDQGFRTPIELRNADPAPLRWTQSADNIPASLERFCAAHATSMP